MVCCLFAATEPSSGEDDVPAGRDSVRRDTGIPMVEKKNPTGALLRSAVIPGWGQFYNERPVKGIVMGSVELGLLGWLLAEHLAALEARSSGDDASYLRHVSRRLDLIWYTSAAWLFGMLDAYVDAYLYSFETENEVFRKETGLGAELFFRF